MTAIDQLPSGSFRVRYRASGKRYTHTFGTHKEAEAFVATLGDSKLPPSTCPRYDVWVAKWYPEHARLVKPSTAERYKKILNLYVIPEIGHLPLDQITSGVIRAWQSRLLGSGLAPATVRLARTVAAMSFKDAVIDDLVPANPFSRVKSVRVPKKQVRILSEEDVLLLASSIRPRWRAMVLTAGYAGLRIGELCALRRRDLDLVNHQVTVTNTRTKADGQWVDGPAKTENSQRLLSIPKFLVVELEEHIASGFASNQLVFTGTRGGALQPDHFRKFPWAKALKVAKLGDLRVHDLRHTAVSLWIRQGASPNLIAYMAGHGSVQYVLDTYGHLYGDEGLELAARLDAGRPPMPATSLAALPARTHAGRQPASPSGAVLL